MRAEVKVGWVQASLKFSVVGAENLCCVLNCIRLLAAALAGISHCFFGCFQKDPKQTGMAVLAGRKTCVSAHSIILYTAPCFTKMAGHFYISLSS